jgi:hypothetical protein
VGVIAVAITAPVTVQQAAHALGCAPCLQVSPELRDLLSGLLAKDVLQRLHVRAAMQHPWVTLNGSAPLHSIRGEGPGAAISTVGAPGAAVKVTQADIDAAIRRSAGSAAIDAVFEEVALVPGCVYVRSSFCDGMLRS